MEISRDQTANIWHQEEHIEDNKAQCEEDQISLLDLRLLANPFAQAEGDKGAAEHQGSK